MTFTPRHIINAMANEIQTDPAPVAVFDPCSGVHPDFAAARVREQLEEAERLNGSQAATAATLDYSAYKAKQEAVTYGAGPTPWWAHVIAHMEHVSWWIFPVIVSGAAAWGWDIFHIGKALRVW